MWANLYDDNGYTTWAAGTTYYWPDGKLTFIAYAPSSVNGTVDGEGVHFPDYSVADAATDQIDLLYSERAYDKQALDDETAGSEITDENPDFTDDSYTGVHLAFKHALSSIVFSVRTKEYYKTANGATITRDIDGTSPEQDRIFTFTNTPKSSTPLNDEAIVVNTMTL